jgi:hypothetical protein
MFKELDGMLGWECLLKAFIIDKKRLKKGAS